MKLNNFSVAAKLWLALGCVIVLLLITLFAAIGRGNVLNARLDNIATAQIDKAETIAQWGGLTQTNVARITASLLSADPAVEVAFNRDCPLGI